MPNAAGGGAGG